MKNHYKSGAQFSGTNWEMITKIQKTSCSTLHRETFDQFVDAYKDPLYSYLRFSGYSKHDSEDLVQELFVKILETDLLYAVKQENGRLRNYLKGALKRVIYKKMRLKHAQKRGGGAEHLPVDETIGAVDGKSNPDEVYDQEWANSLIHRVKNKLFENQPQLTNEERSILTELLNWNAQGIDHKEAANLLKITVPALKSRIHRLRIAFKELLYEEVASTLVNPNKENIENELEALRHSWEKNE